MTENSWKRSTWNWFKTSNLKQWLNGVILQGKRLLEMHDNMMRMMMHQQEFEAGAFQKMMDAVHKMREVERIEEHFFVIAVNKARDWLNEACDLEEIKPYIKEFDLLLPYVGETRDMREHEINYFKKKGKKQKNFVRSVGEPGAATADASSTIVNDNEYLIGGRLNVQAAVSLAERMLPTIQAYHDKLLTELKPDL